MHPGSPPEERITISANKTLYTTSLPPKKLDLFPVGMQRRPKEMAYPYPAAGTLRLQITYAANLVLPYALPWHSPHAEL